MVVRVEILDAFPAKHTRRSRPVWGPGDSIAIRIAVENQSVQPLGDFTIISSFGDTRRDAAFAHVIQLAEQYVARIQPGARVVFTDTAIIATETRDTSLELNVQLNVVSGTGLALEPRIVGDIEVPVLSSGFELETLLVPNQVMLVDYWGDRQLRAKVRSDTDWSFVIRIHNPYETTLEPMALSGCLIDLDYCPRQFTRDIEPLTPRVPPGEYRDFEATFHWVSTTYTWFWNHLNAVVSVCYPKWLRGTCAYARIRLIPDIEAQCAISDIEPGVQIIDDTANCDGSGSAYRFSARAGERYRVDATPANGAFITGAEGTDLYDQRHAELTIPEDGTYYVILYQVSNRNVTFKLNRL